MAKSDHAARALEVEADLEVGEEAPLTAERIQLWLVNYLARVLDIPTESIATENTFESFGLDSAAAVGLTGDLGRWLGRKLDPTLAYDYPTIDAVAEHLALNAG